MCRALTPCTPCLPQARVEAFNAALSELVMYRSRVNVALLQVGTAAAGLGNSG